MNDLNSTKLSGALYLPTKKSNFWECIEESSLIEEVNKITSGWYSFEVTPLTSWEKNKDLTDNTTPLYKFWVRKGGEGRLLIVSTKNDYVSRLLEEFKLTSWFNNTPTVNIEGLLNDLMRQPRITDYSLGAIYARINGYGQDLRTIILYGDDIASASLFELKISPYSTPYRLVLRKNRWKEVINISEKAEIAFNYRNMESLAELDEALKVIAKDLGHLEWSDET